MIKTRCYNQNNHKYPTYGGRGIRVCDRWRNSFDVFLEDMGPRPGDHYSIDRIDNDGNYEPKNCHWSTPTEQARNRGVTRFITANGQTRCLQEWADLLGSNPQTIADRLDRGWDPTQAVLQAPRDVAQPGTLNLTLSGRTMRLFEWARETGLSAATITRRLKRGWTVEQALTTASGGKRGA
jgi:hypothetical protein